MIVLSCCALLDDGPVRPKRAAVDVSACYCNSNCVYLLVYSVTDTSTLAILNELRSPYE